MPADPFEAELLMMAETLAGGEHESSSSEDDDEITSRWSARLELGVSSANLEGRSQHAEILIVMPSTVRITLRLPPVE